MKSNLQINSKKRINILLPDFGLYPTGGFKIAYTYANYLAKQGYKVTVVHAFCMDAQSKLSHYLEYIKLKVKVFFNPPIWFRFDKKLRRSYVFSLNNLSVGDADVSIATAWNTARDLNKLSLEKGKRLYLIQGYEICFAPKKVVDATWCYDMRKIVISKWLQKIGQQMGCSNLEYIPNALNHNKFCIKRQITARDYIVSMMYSPSRLKGSRDGIAALKIVKSKYPALRVRLFGVSERPSNIPGWMEYYSNPSQDILVKNIYNESAVYLCTSYSEGWGLPPMEAMACGCAVLTTANGGVEDFAIHKDTALLCKPGNIEEMATALLLLLEDVELRTKLAYNGSKYVRRFTWKKSCKQFEKVINSL